MRDASTHAGGDGPSPVRIYGALIALASGGLAVWRLLTVGAMGIPGYLMGLVGLFAIVHGLLLFTTLARDTGFARASGPLMITYAVVMLATQVWLASMGRMMPGGMMGDGMMDPGMTWDAGMVLLALLMLASGIIMTRENAGAPAHAARSA